MKLFWQKVISNKSNPLYWPIVFILWLASFVYRLLSIINRMRSKAAVRINVPVISVGNLTVGGAGKTPLVIFLARQLIERKYRVGIVARGYGRRAGDNVFGSGADLCQGSVEDIGDEPSMMAENLPEAYFAIGSPKWKVAQRLALMEKPDIIIVDDGFQHYRLHRDFDIVAIDARYDLRHESIFPLGRLRENAKSLKRAKAIALTRVNQFGVDKGFVDWLGKSFPNKINMEVAFNSSSMISADDIRPSESIVGKRVLAFAGIADANSFAESIRQYKPTELELLSFGDHCRYNAGEIALIVEKIKTYEPDLVLTTHKDYVKVRNFNFNRTVYYITVVPEIVVGAEKMMTTIEGVICG